MTEPNVPDFIVAPDGRVYDTLGNPIPREALKGKRVNGECGYFFCRVSPALRWDMRLGLLVCQGCAEEQNLRARALGGSGAVLPCPVPPICAVWI